MYVRYLAARALAALALLSLTPLAASAEAGIDVDFLLNYYDQDGEHSPVTGGIGTEDLQVIAPVFVVKWAVSENWTLSTDIGVDGITSASTDNIDTEVSSASRQDQRAHSNLTASRKWGNHTWRFGVGLSNEYDYSSVSASVGWSLDLNKGNTTLGANLRHYSDTVSLYDIDGEEQGDADRQTTDVALSLTHVFGKRTVGSIELNVTNQSGFLSTPFHEVILAPTADFPEGRHVTERLPDKRTRTALGLSLNHTFSKRVVGRFYYRFYDDDFGVSAHTVELETHFRLPTRNEAWVFPILRFHTQDSSDYFGLPGTFTEQDAFFTADRDLSEFTSDKYGLGFRIQTGKKRTGFLRHLKSFESRVASYSREDGLDALSVSLALGWRF